MSFMKSIDFVGGVGAHCSCSGDDGGCGDDG
jgi:hypothetical protein